MYLVQLFFSKKYSWFLEQIRASRTAAYTSVENVPSVVSKWWRNSKICKGKLVINCWKYSESNPNSPWRCYPSNISSCWSPRAPRGTTQWCVLSMVVLNLRKSKVPTKLRCSWKICQAEMVLCSFCQRCPRWWAQIGFSPVNTWANRRCFD